MASIPRRDWERALAQKGFREEGAGRDHRF